MKKAYLLCLSVLCSYILCACSIVNSIGNLKKATNASSDSIIASVSSSTASSTSEASTTETSEMDESELQFYPSLSEIPYARIRFSEITGTKQDTHEAIFSEKSPDGTASAILFKDGVHWMDAPSQQVFGEFAFSDAEFLYLPVYSSTGSYRWMAIAYDVELAESNDPYSYFLPPEADDKMFIAVESDTLLLETGEGFNTKTLQWFENGVIVENAKVY